MSTTRTFSLTILLTISLLGDGGQGAIVSPSTASEPPAYDPAEITVSNETDSSRQDAGIVEAVDWAVDRYLEAGLALPDIEIHFHRPRSDCAGFAALHTISDEGHRIDICIGGQPMRRRILLHEFAHAWTHENLPEGNRQAFLAGRGLETWGDGNAEWGQRGTEHAAVIIAWGLNEHCDFHQMVTDEDPAQLAADFALLTGTQPLCGLA